MHEIEKLRRGPDTIKVFNKDKKPQYIISKNMLKVVWKRLQDRLASVDSSTSTVEITNDYAAQFLRHVYQQTRLKAYDWRLHEDSVAESAFFVA